MHINYQTTGSLPIASGPPCSVVEGTVVEEANRAEIDGVIIKDSTRNFPAAKIIAVVPPPDEISERRPEEMVNACKQNEDEAKTLVVKGLQVADLKQNSEKNDKKQEYAPVPVVKGARVIESEKKGKDSRANKKKELAQEKAKSLFNLGNGGTRAQQLEERARVRELEAQRKENETSLLEEDHKPNDKKQSVKKKEKIETDTNQNAEPVVVKKLTKKEEARAKKLEAARKAKQLEEEERARKIAEGNKRLEAARKAKQLEEAARKEKEEKMLEENRSQEVTQTTQGTLPKQKKMCRA